MLTYLYDINMHLTTKPKLCPANNFNSSKIKKQQQHLWHFKHQAKPFVSLNLQTAQRDRANSTPMLEVRKQKNGPKL